MPAASRRRRRRTEVTEREVHEREENGELDSSDSDSEERRAVRLPRKTLLSVTSAEMGQYIEYVRAHCHLTPGQEAELRRQRRLVRNRESAKGSREKRDGILETLQREIESLRAENARLAQENGELRKLCGLGSSERVEEPPVKKERRRKGEQKTPLRLASFAVFAVVFSVVLMAHFVLALVGDPLSANENNDDKSGIRSIVPNARVLMSWETREKEKLGPHNSVEASEWLGKGNVTYVFVGRGGKAVVKKTGTDELRLLVPVGLLKDSGGDEWTESCYADVPVQVSASDFIHEDVSLESKLT